MRALALLAALLIDSTAWSQENSVQERPYFGIASGVFDWRDSRIDDTVPIVKLYGGFRFSERWAVEGSYSEPSTLKEDNFGFLTSADFKIMEIRGLAYFGPLFAGVGYWDADIDSGFPAAAVLFPNGRLQSDESDFSVILGGQWTLKNRWDLRLEYELFEVENSPISMSTLGIGGHFKFGRR
jgi:hypothetical protein